MSSTHELVSIEKTPRWLYSRHSAARALDVSVRMIDYALASGLLEARRLNSRVLIPAEALEKFAASDRVVPKVLAHCADYA